MRAALVAAVIASAMSPALAYRIQAPPPPPPRPRDFWARAADPRPAAVADLHQSLSQALQQLDEIYGVNERQRMDLAQRGRRAARHALSLAPDDVDSGYFVGVFAELTGHAAEAERRLEEYLRRAPEGDHASDARYRLGVIAVRQGRYAAAVERLRPVAQVGDRTLRARVNIALAFALEGTGDVAAAITSLKATDDGGMGDDPTAMAINLTLAVLYDRDDQRTAAFEVLTRLLAVSEGALVGIADNTIRAYPTPVLADQIYYRALATEVSGGTSQAAARDLWLTFEQSGSSAAATARAHEHRLAIEQAMAAVRHPPRRPRRP